MQRVNLGKLETTTLRRYSNLYHLPTVAISSNRGELLDAVASHFAAQELNEEDVLRRFLVAAQRHVQGNSTPLRT